MNDVALATPARTLARDFIALTKPRIISLLLVTTVAPMFVAGNPGWPLVLIVLLVVCGAVAALTDPLSGLVALEVAAVLAVTALLVLAEAMRRMMVRTCSSGMPARAQ